MSRELTSPGMLNAQQSGQNYYFVIEKFPEASYTVTEVSTPDVSLGKIEIKTPYLSVMKPGTSLSFSDLRLTFIVDEDLSNYRQLFKWLLLLKEYDIMIPAQRVEAQARMEDLSGTLNTSLKSDCDLHILTNKKNENLIFRFKECWPYSLGSIALSTKVGPETITCSLSMAFDEFSLVEEP